VDNTSWPEAFIASSALFSGAILLSVLVWQIGRIILTGMTMKDDQAHSRITHPSTRA